MHETWKIIERLEQLADKIESITELVETGNKVNASFAKWITEATEIIATMGKDIEYLKHKRDCI